MIIFILATFAFIALIDFVPLIRYKQTKTAIIFGVIFVCTLTLSLLLFFEVNVPSILKYMANFLEWIGIHY